MSRLTSIKPEEATGKVAEIFANLKKAVGKVPNGYAVVGSHSDDALGAALAFDAAVSRSTLGKADIETIKLVVSNVAGCAYCVAAHTFVGKMSGLAEAVEAVRAAGYTERQLIEINLAIASITFSNLVNRVNDTTIDSPAVE